MEASFVNKNLLGPHAKLVFGSSSLSHLKSSNKHMESIERHSFNNSISIFSPGLDRIVEDVHRLCVEERSFIVYNLPLSELIHPDLINAFMKRGQIYILSHGTQVDTDNCISVLPTGHLILNLCKDTYQQLGLEGKPSMFSKNKPEKFVVDIDLFHPKFHEGTKKYDRISWCLTDRLEFTFDFLVSWTPNDDDICQSSIHKYFNVKGYKCSELKIDQDLRTYSDLSVPEMPLEFSVKDWENCESNPADIFEWLGGVSTDIDMSGEVDSYISTYCYPGPTKEVTKCVYQQYKGFFTTNTIHHVIDKLRDHMKNMKIPWCSVTVHGFVDSPVSWTTKEHGYFNSGDNLYTFILFPDDKYWLYTATAEHDAIS